MKAKLLTLTILLSVTASEASLRGLRRQYNKKRAAKTTVITDLHEWNTADEVFDTISCDVALDVQCTVENGTKPCNGLLPDIVDLCSPDDHPTSITMHYIGGTCNHTSFSLCEDYLASSASNVSYIVATDRNNEVYFEGNVTVDDSFLISNNGNTLNEDISINVYSSSDQSELLQTVTLPACSNSTPLFYFQEVLGPVKLTAFESAGRGNVTFESVFIIDAAYEFSISGTGVVTNLYSMSSIYGLVDLTELVRDTVLESGDNVIVKHDFQLDLSTPFYFTAISNVEAAPTISSEEKCSNSNQMTFTAGTGV